MSFITIQDLPHILTKGFEDGLPWLARFGCSNNVDDIPLLIKCPKDRECPKCTECYFLTKIDKPSNVKYLPYKPRHITSVELPAGNLAISGPFSGCWMGLSIDGSGDLTVYHVATGDSNECKKEFLAITGGYYYFLPAKIIKSTDIKNIEKTLEACGYQTELVSDVYGIITINNESYSVIMGMKNGKYCVAAWIEWEVKGGCQMSKNMRAFKPVLYDYMPSEGEWLSNL